MPDQTGRERETMQEKLDMDSTAGIKLLRLFQKLMFDGRRHYQAELADYLRCSPQTVMRLVREIETVVGASLETGIEARRRWYRITSVNRSRLGLEFEELRYLSICRDLAAPYLPDRVKRRVDESILNLSILMSDHDYAQREKVQGTQFSFSSKGRIDYTPHLPHIETLLKAREEKRVCRLVYRASGGRERTHHFACGRLVSMNGALYALGATLAKDRRTMRHLTSLAVHRILDAELTARPVTFEIPEADLGSFGLPWHEPRTFRIRFRPGKAADYVRERVWADRQRMEEQEDGSLVLEIVTRSEPEVMAWVRSFGTEAELLTPEPAAEGDQAAGSGSEAGPAEQEE
ncbi:MAG: WYL domain-containing protein [Desulfovibrionaceae bacterium]|nr:WYL domain-containing protein [Desulfovibrionaceae bacterium]